MDGQTVTDSGVNQQFAYRISMDAIAEFRVSTNSQGAEFGRNSGAQIQVATRSGGQAFHGGHVSAVGLHREQEAAVDGLVVEKNRAGATRPLLAPDVSAPEAEAVTQEIGE